MSEFNIAVAVSAHGPCRVETFFVERGGNLFRLVVIDGDGSAGWKQLPPIPKRPSDIGWTRTDES